MVKKQGLLLILLLSVMLILPAVLAVGFGIVAALPYFRTDSGSLNACDIGLSIVPVLPYAVIFLLRIWEKKKESIS